MSKLNVHRFIEFGDSQSLNSNEQAIFYTILQHVKLNNPIDALEDLSLEANISQASISRFIRKVGYSSFKEFSNSFNSDLLRLYQRRSQSQKKFQGEEVKDVIYERALKNLQNTYETINKGKLKEIVEEINQAKSISMVGDIHSLTIFYPLQLDILAKGIPCFSSRNMEHQFYYLEHIKDGDVVLYFEVFHEFRFSNALDILRKKKKEKNIKIIGFVQEIDEEIEEILDDVYVYGCKDSKNDGYYSLLLIHQILCEMLYR